MAEQQQSGDEFAAVYRRELPGGGFVAIDVRRRCAERELPRTRVCVERRGRSNTRDATARDAKPPIVIAEADGDEYSPGFTELYRIAADNAAIARALLRLGTRHPERAD
jgi:hypothetical protein